MLDHKAVAGRIKELRGILSQKEFAKRLNYGQPYISDIETGKLNPSVEVLYSISTYFQELGCFDITVDYILKGNQGNRTPSRRKGKKSFLAKSGDNNKLIKLLGQEVFDMKNELIRLREGDPLPLKQVNDH